MSFKSTLQNSLDAPPTFSALIAGPPAPSFSPYHASPQPTQFAARQPKFSSYPTSYPTPGYHTPSKAQSPVKSFVHSPLTRYGVLGK